MKKNELTLCGLGAVKARFAKSPASFVRLFFDAAAARELGPLCKALAAARKVYRCVTADELAKIAETIHHGGVVAVVHATRIDTPSDKTIADWAAAAAPLVLLERVGNPHNLGAIARTAAFLGVRDLVLSEHAGTALPNTAAHRVAEGGLEWMRVWRARNLAELMGALASAGYDVVGAATRGGRIEKIAAPAQGQRVALVLGNEEAGLSPAAARACTRLVTIRGSGWVESLNVSAAAAILLHALIPPRQ